MIHNRLRPLAWIATLGSIGASTALIAACSGQVVPNGTVSSTAQPVSVGEVSGPATACGTGSAHPNVCCEAGPGQAAACVVYPSAPFTQCASGATAYPDPRTCCPLDGNGQCAAPPPPPPNDAGPGSGGTCVYPCPVGWYSPPETSGGGSGGSAGVTCCEASSDGSGFCTGSAGAGTGGGCTCACPACDGDGSCPPCPPCNCPTEPPPPPVPSCDPCPPGWQSPQGEPLLCCAEGPDGTIACFSQGVPPPGDTSDGGTPSAPASCFGGGGGGTDGSTSTECGCSETVGATDYTVTCTSTNGAEGTCTCSESSGGTTGGTMVTEPSTACDDMGALFGACGFPSNFGSGVGTSDGGSAGSGGSSSSSGG